MSGGVSYTPEQVDGVLLALVANGGDVPKTAEMLHDDEFMVSASTLYRWKNELHADRYQQLERDHGPQLERLTIALLRKNMHRAAEIEAELLERAEQVPNEQVPQALKAVADSKSKSVDKLMSLTGRAPEDRAGPGMGELLRGLAAKGLVKVNVNLDVEAPVDADAVEEPTEREGLEPSQPG